MSLGAYVEAVRTGGLLLFSSGTLPFNEKHTSHASSCAPMSFRFLMRSSAIGCTSPLGKLPALNVRNLPCPQWLRRLSARMLRAELPVHRKSTL